MSPAARLHPVQAGLVFWIAGNLACASRAQWHHPVNARGA